MSSLWEAYARYSPCKATFQLGLGLGLGNLGLRGTRPAKTPWVEGGAVWACVCMYEGGILPK